MLTSGTWPFTRLTLTVGKFGQVTFPDDFVGQNKLQVVVAGDLITPCCPWVHWREGGDDTCTGDTGQETGEQGGVREEVREELDDQTSSSPLSHLVTRLSSSLQSLPHWLLQELIVQQAVQHSREGGGKGRIEMKTTTRIKESRQPFVLKQNHLSSITVPDQNKMSS